MVRKGKKEGKSLPIREFLLSELKRKQVTHRDCPLPGMPDCDYKRFIKDLLLAVRDDIIVTQKQQEFITKKAIFAVNARYSHNSSAGVYGIASTSLAAYINSLVGQKVQ